MTRYILSFASLLIFVTYARAGHILKEKKPFCYILHTSDTSHKKISREEKWTIFWKAFTTAINTKDKKSIAALTSKDFYDGGGGTVAQWLDGEVFVNEKQYNKYKSTLKKGVNNFKNEGGGPYKATGKNSSGDLFFEYKNEKWLFGGIVGD